VKTGAGLACIALGAILAFAVNRTPSFLNLHTVGWVLMLVGVVGLLLPKRTYGWLGRRMQVRRSYPNGYPNGRVQQVPVPPYVAGNPGTARIAAGLPPEPSLLDQEDLIDGSTLNGQPQGTYRTVDGRTEVIEDMYEQP
jgi:hypothetical protein